MEAAVITAFIIGYLLITFEHLLGINKASIALLTGGLCWTFYILAAPDKQFVGEQLSHHLGELSGILFFLLGAMTIVELIDAYDGFEIITARIRQTDQRKLLWTVSILTFFLSAVLDNLTTTIVIVSMLRKLISDPKQRVFFAGMVVVAANAGGAWSPIGDVTTTMLWIGGQITSTNIILKLLIPSLVCLVTPLLIISLKLRGRVDRPAIQSATSTLALPRRRQLMVFSAGVGILLCVPFFKTITHLPPFMGMLIGLGVLWVLTELMHGGKDEKEKQVLSVAHALRKIDTPSILFFLGVLMSIAALESTGVLANLARWMTTTLENETLIVMSIGLLSAVIDNVPLVAAAQGMYGLDQYPVDHYFWEFLAYCTGTGGSALIIGSAAGVAAMGMEKISFFWYVRRITLLALLGYFAGAAVYILQHQMS